MCKSEERQDTIGEETTKLSNKFNTEKTNSTVGIPNEQMLCAEVVL